MAQKICLLISLATLSFHWAAAQGPAAPSPSATPVPTQPSATPPKPTVTPTATPALPPKDPKSLSKPKETPVERMLEKEQSPQFKANLERWNKLSKAQQDELRKREKIRSERILNEINDAIIQSGLQLDAQQRQIFTFRYAQERRTIEEKMQQEIEQKRREAISRLIQELTEEFQPLPPPPPHPGPDVSPTSNEAHKPAS